MAIGIYFEIFNVKSDINKKRAFFQTEKVRSNFIRSL